MPDFQAITYEQFVEKKRLADAGRGRWGRVLLDIGPGEARVYDEVSTSARSSVEKAAKTLGITVEVFIVDGSLWIARPPEQGAAPARPAPLAAGGIGGSPAPVARPEPRPSAREQAIAQGAITKHREDKPACTGRLTPDQDGDPHCMACGWSPTRMPEPEPEREPGTRRRGPSMAGVGQL